MSILTNFLKLVKPEKNDYVDVEEHISNNLDKIDEKMENFNLNKLDKGGYTGTAQNLLTEISKIASKTVLGRMIVGKGLTVDSSGRTSVVSKNDGIIVNDNDIQLNVYDGVDSTSTTRAGSAKAIKIAYDKANTAIPKTDIVNDLTSGGADKVGSAEMVKKLGIDKQDKNDSSLKTPTQNIVGGMNDLIWYQQPRQLIGGGSAENTVDLLEYIKTLKEGIYRCDYSRNGWFKNLPTPMFDSQTAYCQDFFIIIRGYRGTVWDNTTQVEFIAEDDYSFFKAIIQYNVAVQKYTPWELFFANTSKYGYAPFGIVSKTKFFIQDKITKSFNETYIDKDTGKIYRCIVTSTNDVTVTSNFEIVTNNELAKRNSEYIVEYKEIDENTRYRKWNSGLLEIWGVRSNTGMVTDHILKFPIPFKDTNYNVHATYRGTVAMYCGVLQDTQTVSGCTIRWNSTSGTISPYYAVGRWK